MVCQNIAQLELEIQRLQEQIDAVDVLIAQHVSEEDALKQKLADVKVEQSIFYWISWFVSKLPISPAPT